MFGSRFHILVPLLDAFSICIIVADLKTLPNPLQNVTRVDDLAMLPPIHDLVEVSLLSAYIEVNRVALALAYTSEEQAAH